MKSCRDIQARAAYLAALPEADSERKLAVEHARNCPACAEALAEGERVIAMIDKLPPPPPPSELALKRASEAILRELGTPRGLLARLGTNARTALIWALPIVGAWAFAVALALVCRRRILRIRSRHRAVGCLGCRSGGRTLGHLLGPDGIRGDALSRDRDQMRSDRADCRILALGHHRLSGGQAPSPEQRLALFCSRGAGGIGRPRGTSSDVPRAHGQPTPVRVSHRWGVLGSDGGPGRLPDPGAPAEPLALLRSVRIHWRDQFDTGVRREATEQPILL